ncbi:MAG: hypothetical protein NVSMB27_12240 [Ktedonobacteraceae bacterium]
MPVDSDVIYVASASLKQAPWSGGHPLLLHVLVQGIFAGTTAGESPEAIVPCLTGKFELSY